MGTQKRTADYLLEQLGDLDVDYKAMFGEYAVYCDDKVVGFITNDTFFLKPTEVDDDRIAAAERAPAYPGGKLWIVIDGDMIEDRAWLQDAVQSTADELPPPEPKKAKRKPPRSS